MTRVQYAKVTTKRCPMYDPACAARVIEHIQNQYPRSFGACDCGWVARVLRENDAVAQQREFALAALRASAAGEPLPPPPLDVPTGLAIEHTATCGSHREIPFDAAALVESKCGRFTRGAHAGQLRGWASIEVTTAGGWKKSGPGERNGRVIYPGTILAIRIEGFVGKTYLEV